MADLAQTLEAARVNLETCHRHVEVSKAQYESAKEAYQSAKAVFEAAQHASDTTAIIGLTATSQLCTSCRGVRWKAMFDTLPARTKPRRIKIGDIFHAVEMQAKCVLCKFLISAFQLGNSALSEKLHAFLKPQDTAIYFADDAEGFPWFTQVGLATAVPSCVFFWLQTGPPTTTGEPRICISFKADAGDDTDGAGADHAMHPRVREPLEAYNGSVNYGLIQSWVSVCNEQHSNRCHALKLPPSLQLLVIDVVTRQIVRHDDESRYIALSYVWGKGASAQLSWLASHYAVAADAESEPEPEGVPARRSLPQHVPQTMEDAMTFVAAMGERYLWVDLFCINQSDVKEKQRQINAMDRIYAASYLTLINLDGADSDFGLPGVSRPLSQTQQPTVDIGGGRLMATYVHSVWQHDQKAVWNTRAWTLQERLLSPRCLVFAKSSISMSCQSAFFHDSIVPNARDGVETRLSHEFFREDGSGINLNHREWDYKTYDALISAFTGRELTLQSDAHDACQGSLARIKARTGYEFCFGIAKDDVHRALLWSPHHEWTLHRRNHFPSWSWLGWAGRVEYPYWVTDMSDYVDEEIPHQGIPPARKRTRLYNENNHMESADVVRFDASKLYLKSTVAKFNLRCVRVHGASHKYRSTGSQQPAKAVGDHWTLLDADNSPLRNLAGEYESFESTDVFFRLDPSVSKLLHLRDTPAEFVFVHHWPRIRDSYQSKKWLYDMISVLLITRNDDETATRIAAVLLKAGDCTFPQLDHLTQLIMSRILSHRQTHNLLLISKLLSQRDHASPFTLVLDTLEQPARRLMREYVRRAKLSKTQVVYLAFESPVRPQDVDVFVTCYNKTPDQISRAVATAMSGSASKLQSSTSPSTLNLTAYLSSFLAPRPHQPQSSVSMVAVYHTDIPLSPPRNPSVSYMPAPLSLLSYLATTILTVHSLQILLAGKFARERSQVAPQFGLAEEKDGVLAGLKPTKFPQGVVLRSDERGIVLEMEHRRKSGRGVHEWYFLPDSSTQQPSITAQTFRETIILLDDHALFRAPNVHEPQPSDQELAGMTFELGLTERQRLERDGVVLPYFDAQKNGGAAGEGGRILYDMGSEDDFDEEEDEI